MFERILVPLDGSELGQLALPYAEELAKALSSEVTLIFVCDTADCRYRYEHQVYVEKMAQQVSGHIKEKGPKITVKSVVLDGHPAAAIIDYAERNDISLIIVATHGRSGIMPWAMGSIANKILYGVNMPVLLVRASVPTPAGGKEEQILSPILVPLDGSEAGESALPYVRELTEKLDLEVILFQVIARGQHVHTVGGLSYFLYPEQQVESMKASAEQYLDGVGRRFAGTKATVRSELKFGDPAAEIIKFAGETDTCLVAMATHGHSGIMRWAFGSVTHKVLHGGNTPLLLVRALQVKAQPLVASALAMGYHSRGWQLDHLPL